MKAALYILAAFCAGIASAETAPARLNPPTQLLPETELADLRVAVSRCWNVGSLSTEALRTKVVVLVTINSDGRPERMTLQGYEGGSEAAAVQAFESARRAVIRCGAAGFPLPLTKDNPRYEATMTFDPTEMRIR